MVTWRHCRRSCNSDRDAERQDRSVHFCRGGPAVPRVEARRARRRSFERGNTGVVGTTCHVAPRCDAHRSTGT